MDADHHHAEPATAELAVDGMTCSNCARHVTEAIQSVPAVASASVQLEAGRATVRWKSAADLPAVIQAVKDAGYEAAPLKEPASDAVEKKSWSLLSNWQFNVVFGLCCTLPLMAGEWIFRLSLETWYHWVSFFIALPVQIFCGARFYSGAWRQIKQGRSNMDTLVALGSTTAFGYSVWALFAGVPGHLYFMESAAIITLISLGHWVESRTIVKAEGSLQKLLRLAPATARRRDAHGHEAEVPVASLRADDLVILKPGDHVPVDGVVADGGSTVDESMLTGESLPVNKTVGDKLFAGTANLDGRLFLKVTATGEATALAHIIAAVARAQTSRADIQRLGDRISNVFVPVVVLIAIATGLWWGLFPDQAAHVDHWLSQYLWHSMSAQSPLASAFIHAAAVLIIACPCAMGLATPVAIMAGTNAAARRGILIRDGVALERAGRLTAVIFDKTGTLTQGKPAVAKQQLCPGARPDVDTMKLAAALARQSNHPISLAVAKLYADDFPFTDWQEVRGSGVQAKLSLNNDLITVRLGSLNWLRTSGVDLKDAPAFEKEWAEKGATLLGVSANQQLLGLLALRDTLKPGVAEVARELARGGLKIYLVTGDNPLTAQAIAKEAGIASENVLAEVRPERKSQFIHDLQAKGERVAFVGDGINDAPALEAADLGIAVSRASDVAREAADIILLKSEIQAIPEALGLARATLRTIKWNLFWAFFYNVVGIPLAALGLMSPVLCALAMGVSDLIVIGNALRLLKWKN